MLQSQFLPQSRGNEPRLKRPPHHIAQRVVQPAHAIIEEVESANPLPPHQPLIVHTAQLVEAVRSAVDNARRVVHLLTAANQVHIDIVCAQNTNIMATLNTK